MNETRKFSHLKKSATDSKIAGVCGGFGEYTPLASWMWRAIFLVSIFICGFGIIIYVVLWACMPSADTPMRQDRGIDSESIDK